MSCDNQGEIEFDEFDDDMSSWSSAFDPIVPRSKSPDKKLKSKQKKKKSSKKKRKKEKKQLGGESSSAAGPVKRAQNVPHRDSASSEALPTAHEQQEPATPAPSSPSLGSWVYQAFWEPTRGLPLPRPLPKGRAAAKMLVRAGFRCQCHFLRLAACPFSRQRQVRDLVANATVRLRNFTLLFRNPWLKMADLKARSLWKCKLMPWPQHSWRLSVLSQPSS